MISVQTVSGRTREGVVVIMAGVVRLSTMPPVGENVAG